MGVTVKVTNLAETFLAFWELAKDKPLPKQVSLWETRYAEPHRAVLNFYEEHYNDLAAPTEEVFSRYPDVISTIRTVSAAADTIVAASVDKCAALGIAPSGHHVVMVGRFSSNAWADLFEGAPTCFYALELIPDVTTLAIMAAHETTHVLHHNVSDVPFDGTTVAEKLMLEGLATLVSEVAVPGLKDETYLWPGYSTTTEGQEVTAWLADCTARRLELKGQLLRDLGSDDPATLGRYFGVGPKYRHERTPTRAGYAVGYWLLHYLHQHFELSDLVRWERELISQEIAETLLLSWVGENRQLNP